MILPRRKQSVLCLMLALGAGEAMAAGWDCQKGADGKEWVCVSGKNKPQKPAEEEAAAKPKTHVEEPEVETRAQEVKLPPRLEVARPRPEARPPRPSGQEEPIQEAKPEVVPPPRPALRRAELEQPVQVMKKAVPPPEPIAEVKAPLKTGWNCHPGEEKEWECSLVGPDPRGQPHVVGGATVNWEESPDMTREDEMRFSSIMARLPSDPWALSCGKKKYEWTPSTDFLMTEADKILREKSPLEITSDRAELLKGESSNYQGAAELVRADQRLYGDFVTHNRESGALNAQGNVIYREKGLAFASDTAFMKLGSDEGVLRNSQFILETTPARGTSRITHIDSKTKTRYETVTYTTCPPGNQDWLLHASTTTIDKEVGVGTAKNAWLSFKGVPVLYTPYIRFPVDDRRQSGFLTPYAGYSKQNGFDFTLPYYLNLAPNYDLTLLPRYLNNRGELLRADFRYLSSMGTGRLFGDYLPHDKKRNTSRGQFGWIDDTRFTDKLTSHADVHWVSDDRYLYELGTLLGVNNAINVRSWGTLNYAGGEFLGGNYAANMLVDYYQTLDPTIPKAATPYYRLPQFTAYYNRDLWGSGLQFSSSAEIGEFYHSVSVAGQRLNLRPRIYYPFQDTAGYITPSLTMQHTQYWLRNLNAGESSSFTRTAPIFSVDSGTVFEREFSLWDSPMQQTLEPRLFYLWVPKVAQPYNYTFAGYYQGLNFDTAEYDFNFYQLFRDNRFAGSDRLSDANQLSAALTTRFINQETGLEKLKLSAGKIFYFKNPQVHLYDNLPEPNYRDNLVGDLSSMLTEHWSFRSSGQYSPKRNQLDRAQIMLQYNNYANQLFNMSYRYRRDPYQGTGYPTDPNNPRGINQTDFSFRLPISTGWYAVGRWQYDLHNQVTTQTLAGIERETCCWRFSLMGLRYLNGITLGTFSTPTTISANNAVYFQIELKGFGRFGDQVDQFLSQTISGFRMDNDAPHMYQ